MTGKDHISGSGIYNLLKQISTWDEEEKVQSILTELEAQQI